MLLPAYTLHSVHFAPGMQLVHAIPCNSSSLFPLFSVCCSLHVIHTAQGMQTLLLPACRTYCSLHVIHTAHGMQALLLPACCTYCSLHVIHTAHGMQTLLLPVLHYLLFMLSILLMANALANCPQLVYYYVMILLCICMVSKNGLK